MRRRDPLIGAALGALAGGFTCPLIEVAVRATIDVRVNALAVFGGALLAVAFFAVSAIVAAQFQNSENLRAAMLITYGTKTALVLVALQSLQLDNSDELAFVLSMFVSALAYLIFQTAYIAKWRRRYRHMTPSMSANH